MSELSCADDDHPLKTEFSFSNLQKGTEGEFKRLRLARANPNGNSLLAESSENVTEKITKELNSVAVDWKGLRTAIACSCTTPFDQFSGKVRGQSFPICSSNNMHFLLFRPFRATVIVVERSFAHDA